MEFKGQSNWIVWVVATGAIISLGVHAYTVVRSLFDINEKPLSVQTDKNLEKPISAVDDLIDWMPFGQADEDMPPNDARSPNIRLKLLGTVLTNSPSRSSAFISIGTQAPRRFLVGDEIAERRRLVEVFNNYITLRSKNGTEVLSLTKKSPLILPKSDSVSKAVGANGELDTLRNLIFYQAGRQIDSASGSSPADR